MRITSRAEWGARPPKRRLTIETPTRELWLHHTAGDHRGAAGVRNIQDFHMDSRGWSDIAYSYLIDRHTLEIFEGRGAGIAGGHTKGHNTHSHAICVMGNFENYGISGALLDTIAGLVAHGHSEGWWPDQLTGGHRDAPGAQTACPGRYLWAQIPEINRKALGGTTVEPTEIVRQSQQRLIDSGFALPWFGADGIWGEESDTALKEALEAIDDRDDLVDDLTARLEECLSSPASNAIAALHQALSHYDQ